MEMTLRGHYRKGNQPWADISENDCSHGGTQKAKAGRNSSPSVVSWIERGVGGSIQLCSSCASELVKIPGVHFKPAT